MRSALFSYGASLGCETHITIALDVCAFAMASLGNRWRLLHACLAPSWALTVQMAFEISATKNTPMLVSVLSTRFSKRQDEPYQGNGWQTFEPKPARTSRDFWWMSMEGVFTAFPHLVRHVENAVPFSVPTFKCVHIAFTQVFFLYRCAQFTLCTAGRRGLVHI